MEGYGYTRMANRDVACKMSRMGLELEVRPEQATILMSLRAQGGSVPKCLLEVASIVRARSSEPARVLAGAPALFRLHSDADLKDEHAHVSWAGPRHQSAWR